MPPRKDKRFKVLLALPSLLYAPIYLAKILAKIPGSGNGTAFQKLDFQYKPDFQSEGQADALIEDVVTKADSFDECLAAIADPYRAAALLPEAKYHRPKVVSGLVRHMAYWISDGDTNYNANLHKPHTHFNKIISHPPHMTGFAVAIHYGINKLGFDTAEDATKYIYSKTLAGFEHLYYRKFNFTHYHLNPNRDSRKRFAFMSTDPLIQYDSSRELCENFSQMPEYQNTFMTGVITSDNLYEKSHEQTLIEDMVASINKATEIIYKDPEYAAFLLKTYSDAYIQFDSARYPFKSLVKAFSDLADQNLYYIDGKVPISDLALGAGIRRAAHELNPEAETLDAPENIEKYCSEFIVENDKLSPKPERHDLPLWVSNEIEKIADNKASAITSALQYGGGALLIIIMSLLVYNEFSVTTPLSSIHDFTIPMLMTSISVVSVYNWWRFLRKYTVSAFNLIMYFVLFALCAYYIVMMIKYIGIFPTLYKSPLSSIGPLLIGVASWGLGRSQQSKRQTKRGIYQRLGEWQRTFIFLFRHWPESLSDD